MYIQMHSHLRSIIVLEYGLQYTVANIWFTPPKILLVDKRGLVRDLNPGPLAPKARIIPLDQRATCYVR